MLAVTPTSAGVKGAAIIVESAQLQNNPGSYRLVLQAPNTSFIA